MNTAKKIQRRNGESLMASRLRRKGTRESWSTAVHNTPSALTSLPKVAPSSTGKWHDWSQTSRGVQASSRTKEDDVAANISTAGADQVDDSDTGGESIDYNAGDARAPGDASQELGDSDDAPLSPPTMFSSADFNHEALAQNEGEVNGEQEQDERLVKDESSESSDDEDEAVPETAPDTLPRRSRNVPEESEAEEQEEEEEDITSETRVPDSIALEKQEDDGEDTAEPIAQDGPGLSAQASTSKKPYNHANRENPIEDVQVTRSDQHMSSPNSIFDVPNDPPPDLEISSSIAIGKRKRQSSDQANSPMPAEQMKRKKQRGSVFSPPTSVDSMPERKSYMRPSLSATLAAISMGQKVTDRGSPSMKRVVSSQPTLNSWAKPLAGQPILRHPMFNPSSPKYRIPNRVVARRTMVHNSSTESEEQDQEAIRSSVRRGKQELPRAAQQSSEDEMLASHAKPKNVYKSPKRKKGALESRSTRTCANGVSSSASGVQDAVQADANETAENLSGETMRERMVTPSNTSQSNRKRKSQTRSPKSARSARSSNPDDHPSGTDDGESDDGSDASEKEANPQLKHTCKVCHQRFKRSDQLSKHLSRPNVHKAVFECQQCQQTFMKRGMFVRHKELTGHDTGSVDRARQGTKGQFSEDEYRKLNRYRDRFCAEHEIDYVEYNQMMTNSARRGAQNAWPWEFITKSEFLEDFYNVLPNRNRKSMQRYRERTYQNVERKTAWTREDDDDLVKLVVELGQRWVEIGQRLSRTQDAVSQRWRNKLSHRSDRVDGTWSEEETDALVDAVRRLKEYMNIPNDSSSDHKIRWSTVSDRLGHARSGQQCANRWRIINGKTATKPRGRPSTKSRSSGNFKSSEYVTDSEEDEEQEAEAEAEEQEQEQEQEQIGGWKATNGKKRKARKSSTPVAVDETESGADTSSRASRSGKRRGDAAARVQSVADELSDEAVAEAESESEAAVSNDSNEEEAGPSNAAGQSQSNKKPVSKDAADENRLEGDDEQPADLEPDTTEPMGGVVSANASFGGVSPELPPRYNQLDKKTPGRIMRLSQVFGNTQANTSVLKPTMRTDTEMLLSDKERPSPDIQMRLRPGPSSQYSPIMQEQVDETDQEEEEETASESHTSDEDDVEPDIEDEAEEGKRLIKMEEGEESNESEEAGDSAAEAERQLKGEDEEQDMSDIEPTSPSSDSSDPNIYSDVSKNESDEEEDSEDEEDANEDEDEDEDPRDGGFMSSIVEAAAKSRSQRQTPAPNAAAAAGMSINTGAAEDGDETSSSGDSEL